MNTGWEVCLICSLASVYPTLEHLESANLYYIKYECRICGLGGEGFFTKYELDAAEERRARAVQEALKQIPLLEAILSRELDAIERGDFWPQAG